MQGDQNIPTNKNKNNKARRMMKARKHLVTLPAISVASLKEMVTSLAATTVLCYCSPRTMGTMKQWRETRTRAPIRFTIRRGIRRNERRPKKIPTSKKNNKNKNTSRDTSSNLSLTLKEMATSLTGLTLLPYFCSSTTVLLCCRSPRTVEATKKTLMKQMMLQGTTKKPMTA